MLARDCAGERQRLLPSPTRCVKMRPMGTAVEDQLELLLAERAISRVLHSYSRGADRCDLELMRSCYWPDGTDDHGSHRFDDADGRATRGGTP